MAKKEKQSAGQLSVVLAGQLSKSEKRIKLSRDIRILNDQAHKSVKAVKTALLIK